MKTVHIDSCILHQTVNSSLEAVLESLKILLSNEFTIEVYQERPNRVKEKERTIRTLKELSEFLGKEM